MNIVNVALNRNTIIVVFIVTVSIRIILSLIALDFLGSKLNVDFNHVPDGYDHIAENIIAGRGFWGHGGPTFERGPVYPLLIALVFIVLSKSAFAVRLLLSIIDGITAVVLYHIGKRLSSNRTGLLSAYAFALYPLSIWYTLKMWSEPLLALVVTITTLLMIKSSEDRKNDFLFA